jgi:hypothetical protein
VRGFRSGRFSLWVFREGLFFELLLINIGRRRWWRWFYLAEQPKLGTRRTGRGGCLGLWRGTALRGGAVLFGSLAGDGDGAQDFVGDGERGFHFCHIVDAHHVGAGQDSGCYGRGGGELGFQFRGGGGEERLARWTYDERVFELGQIGEAGEDLRVLFLALAEAEAGVEDNREAIYTGAAGAADGGVEILSDGEHHVGDGAEFAPGFGGAAHVVEDEAGVVLDDGLGEEGIPGETAGVVDDFGAVFDSEFGYFGFIGIDRDGDAEFALEAFEDGDEAADFLGGGDAGAAGLGGFGSDVDDVGALLFEFEGAGKSAVGILVETAVGERVGCDVEDAHDEGSFAETDLAVL